MDLLEVPKSMLYNFQISNPPYSPPADSPTSTQFFWQSHLPPEPSPPPCSPPQPPKPLPGTFEADMLSGHFSLQWASKEDFVAWREEEQKKKSIEFWENRRIWDGYRYDETVYYVCSRGAPGGATTYMKKNLHWQRKVPAKRTGCKCSLTVKTYLDTKTVLGKYNESHNHEIGNANLRLTRILKETRELIAGLLRSGVTSDNIVRLSSLVY